MSNDSILAIVLMIGGIVSMTGNVFYSLRLSRLKSDKETLTYYKELVEEKDTVIKDMLARKNEMKHQYSSILAENHRLKAELETYKRFHNH